MLMHSPLAATVPAMPWPTGRKMDLAPSATMSSSSLPDGSCAPPHASEQQPPNQRHAEHSTHQLEQCGAVGLDDGAALANDVLSGWGDQTNWVTTVPRQSISGACLTLKRVKLHGDGPRRLNEFLKQLQPRRKLFLAAFLDLASNSPGGGVLIALLQVRVVVLRVVLATVALAPRATSM